MAWSHGRHWSSELIHQTLQSIIDDLHRMPTANELRRMGQNDLACAISRRGGFRAWATIMGVHLKGTETHRGQEAEEAAIALLSSKGIVVVRQSTRSEFDLIAAGRRVDVKSARPSQYGSFSSTGWTFALRKVPATCDYYMLLCLSPHGEVERVYLIPAEKAKIKMITITPKGKYELYRDGFDVLTS